jgi:hypothetical protein
MQANCPSCGAGVRQIWIIDKTHNAHGYLEYTARESERSGWTGRFPIEGCIASSMCEACGLVQLYALDYESMERRQNENRGALSEAEDQRFE